MGKRVTAAVVCVALGMITGAVSAETLGDAVEAAVTKHPTVAAAESERQAADEAVGEARAGFFPTLDLKAASGYEASHNDAARRARALHANDPIERWRTEANVSAVQTVFDGFSTWERFAAAKGLATAAGHLKEQAAEDVGFAAVVTYLDVLRAREVQALSEAHLAAQRKLAQDVRSRTAGGLTTEADVIQADARLALAESSLTEAKGLVRVAEASYLEVTGHRPTKLAKPGGPRLALPTDVEAAVLSGLAERPRVRAVSEVRAAREREATAAESAYYPRVTLEVGGTWNKQVDGSDERDWDVTALVVARQNLYSGGADTARLGQARARARAAGDREAEDQRRIERDIRQAFSALTAAREALPQLATHTRDTTKVLDAYRQQFLIGARTLLDLVNVERELFLSRVALTNAESKLLENQYRLAAVMGKLRQAVP